MISIGNLKYFINDLVIFSKIIYKRDIVKKAMTLFLFIHLHYLYYQHYLYTQYHYNLMEPETDFIKK